MIVLAELASLVQSAMW